MPQPFRIFVGYDSKEPVAYHVLCHSLIKTSSVPFSVIPIALNNLAGIFRRERLNLQSTEFSFSRFLVPLLSEYVGWSLFMDCDMLVRHDIADLFILRDERYAAMVCKHDYVPKDTVKFLGQTQTQYAKKNWSSVILFNNSLCKKLTVDYVNSASGLELHQFKWLESDNQIGSLPLEWNWLVGEYPHNPLAKNVHFTRGGPYFKEYNDCDYADEWFAMLKGTTFAA